MNKRGVSVVALVICVALIMILGILVLSDHADNTYEESTSYYNYYSNNEKVLDNRVFNILVSEENKDLDPILQDYMNKNGYKCNIDYAGTLEIMDKLNSNMQYDAIWAANSIWTYMVDTKVATLSNSKAICLSPIVFGIKKSKAEELGFIDKQVYTEDILNAVSSGKLKFAMSNPVTTNSGASAYLGILYTIAGNPEVLTEDMLNDVSIKGKLKSFFSGLERTSGTEDYLAELFLNGDYEAVYSYESSIININKELENSGKEPLYVIYPFDGVPFSDNPFVYIDRKDEKKAAIFTGIQNYLLSQEGKNLLVQHGRRTWYGGLKEDVNKNVFNPDWGINTTRYITPVKYPTSDVIKLALNVYQSQYRKPIHVVFCLDFSGSMTGEGYEELKNAMEYILSDQASDAYIQFSNEDIVEEILFANSVLKKEKTNDGLKTDALLKAIYNTNPSGGTAIYKATIEALNILRNEDKNVRNRSIILMTDGVGNIGTFKELKNKFNSLGQDIPVYSIMFGEASPTQLEEIAKLTNGKVFDGKSDLEKAFKEVRGYN